MEIADVSAIAGTCSIKITPCHCDVIPCDLKDCKHIVELEEKIKQKDEVINTVKGAINES
ncbi:MAG: hypothetical protein GY797_38985 [Deltaproteobacteria bacterium]|nr:hypothetical protein [Deltaproteobacteria bacterium]